MTAVCVSGDRELVPAPAGSGRLSAGQPPESVRKRQAVRARPALH